MIHYQTSSGGWYPRLRGDHVAFGWGSATIVHIPTGRAVTHLAHWVCGWLDDERLLVLQDGDWQLWVMRPDGTREPFAYSGPAPGARAYGGGWGFTHNGRVVHNGIVLSDDPRNLGFVVNGDWCAHAQHVGGEPEWQGWHWQVYHQGQFVRTVVPQIPAHWTELNEVGEFYYGDGGRARVSTPHEDIDISVTTNGADLCRYLGGWTIIGNKATDLYDLWSGMVYHLQHGAAGFSAWDARIAYNDDQGRLTVETPEGGTPVTVPFAFQEPPVIPPIGRKVLIGAFHTFHNNFAFATSDGSMLGKRPETAGTITVITDPNGLPAERPDGTGFPMLVSPECLWEVARHPEWWPQIKGVYLAHEGSQADWERFALSIDNLKEDLGLPRGWPYVSYTAGHIYPNLTADILGVQVYPGPPGETPAQLLSRGRDLLAQVAQRPVALIAGAYTRNGQWTGKVADLFPVYAQLCSEFQNIEYLLAFSDGRKFGMRWLERNGEPDIFRAWTALVEAGR